MSRSLLVSFTCAAALAAAPAHADLWAYLDSQGNTHFASTQVDARYELFFRSGAAGERPQAAAQPDTPRAVAVPTRSASKLDAFFDISPAYKQVKHHLREAARTHRVDYDLLKAVIATESGFDSRAVSPRGAVGLMQVMPATAERWGLRADARGSVERQLNDPRTNIAIGARYLRHLIDLFPGRLDLALAAYNAGEGAVMRAGHRIPAYRETQHYVQTVLQLHAMLKPPAAVAPPAADRGVQVPPQPHASLPTGARRSMPPPMPGLALAPAQDNYTD